MMKRGRPKGIAKSPNSGRQKGTGNVIPGRKAVAESVAETFARLGFNPIEELVKLMPQLSPDSQMKAIIAITPYIAAPLKAPEAPAQPAIQFLANVDRMALLQAANMPQSEGDSLDSAR
jgi:hypothetical protein